MVANYIQNNIFSCIDGFKEYEDILKTQKFKRVHYKQPSYIKQYKNDTTDDGFLKDDIATWGRMQQIYIQLANFFPFIFENVETKDFGKFRLWVDYYDKDFYTHKGTRYKGQFFKFITAEIIGTECWYIEQRLDIHEKVLNMLVNKVSMDKIEEFINEALNTMAKS